VSGAGRTPRTPQELCHGRRTAAPEPLGGRSTWAADRFVQDEVLGILGPGIALRSPTPLEVVRVRSYRAPLTGDRRAVRTLPGDALPGRLVDGMAAELALARDLLTEHG